MSYSQSVSRSWIVLQILLWVLLTLVIAFVLVFSFANGYDLDPGDVAPRDIRSPVDITYVSAIRSRQAQDEAGRNVSSVFTSPDPQVARQQLDRMRQVLAFLSALRADIYASDVQKYAWVLAVPELATLSQNSVNTILILSEADWNRMQLESLRLLDQVIRQAEIREADLTDTRDRLPALVSLELPQEIATAVVDMVKRFIQPNVFYDEAATSTLREQVRTETGPAFRTLRSGEIILREGSVVSELDVEALTELGLTSRRRDSFDVGVTLLLSAIMTFSLGVYLWNMQHEALIANRTEWLLFLLLFIFFLLARLLVPSSGDFIPYLFPSAALAMLVTTTIGKSAGVGAVALLSIVGGWIAGRSLTYATLVFLSGLFAMLTLPRYEQVGAIFRSGLISGMMAAIAIFVFSADLLDTDPISLLLKMSVCVGGGVISGGLTVGGLFLLTPLFDLATTFRLVELSSPNHPLLQRLLREAPATFNHVMMVTSLAEQAAERIGANALLTRVGTYYHDVGKLIRPYFFVENQQGLSNPHERLDPYTSADILIGHVRDGIRLAQQYRLPARVRAFIPEHHGTMKASFFYHKAVEAAGGEAGLVDESQFRYPGPKPQSKETLLVMLADSCEAATRARKPSTPDELVQIVDTIFEQRMRDGQIDECPITVRELTIVKATYVELLRGAYHPRVKYPESKQNKRDIDEE
ncbi:MAG: HDIG domain-containing protein [Anaerolineae bacterium]|nr:HDIG domain-containing protein [Anaerolineae bacterium]